MRRVASVAAAIAAATEAVTVFMISLFNIKALGSTLGNDHRTPQCTLKIHIVLPFAGLSLKSFLWPSGHGHQNRLFQVLCSPISQSGQGPFPLCCVMQSSEVHNSQRYYLK